MPAAENPYPAYFKEIQDAEEARKTSLETRAAAIIGVSGGIVTLVLALAGLATKSDSTFSLTEAARDDLKRALTFFIISAIVAILAAFPLLYKTVLPEGLTWIVTSAWNEPPDAAALRIGATRAGNLGWNKRINDIKVAILALALLLQLVGIFYIARAASSILGAATVVG